MHTNETVDYLIGKLREADKQRELLEHKLVSYKAEVKRLNDQLNPTITPQRRPRLGGKVCRAFSDTTCPRSVK